MKGALDVLSVECHRDCTGITWYVNIGSGNDLVPSGNKPLAQPMLTQIYVATWHRVLSPAGLEIPNSPIPNARRNSEARPGCEGLQVILYITAQLAIIFLQHFCDFYHKGNKDLGKGYHVEKSINPSSCCQEHLTNFEAWLAQVIPCHCCGTKSWTDPIPWGTNLSKNATILFLANVCEGIVCICWPFSSGLNVFPQTLPECLELQTPALESCVD